MLTTYTMQSTKPIGVIPLLDVKFVISATKPAQFHITHPQRRTVP